MNEKYIRHSVLKTTLTMLLLASIPFSAVQAASRYWTTSYCGSGAWDSHCWNSTSDTDAWDGAGPPVSGDYVYLYNHTGTDHTVTYSGASISLGDLEVRADGSGDMNLNVRNGSTISSMLGTADSTSSGAKGIVTVDGVGSNWTNSRPLRVGLYGNGGLNITNGGSVSNTSGYLGFYSGSHGTAKVDGAGSGWTNSSSLNVGNHGNGSLIVTNGGSVFSAKGSLGSSSDGEGTVTVYGAGSRWINSGSMSVGGSASVAGGTGTVNIQNSGQVDVANTMKVWGGGAVNLSGGSLNADTIDTTATGAQFNFTGGTLAVNTFNGDLVNQGGTLAPAYSTGFTTVNGDYSQDINSTLFIEIGGLIAGAEYDTLDITGIATLAGILDVDLYDLGGGMFEVSEGDTFDIVTAETINGEFDFLSLVSLGNGLTWQIDYLIDEIGSTDVVRLSAISAVPVPESVWLFGSGLIGLTAFSGRRKNRKNLDA